jgi:hypothetical protein
MRAATDAPESPAPHPGQLSISSSFSPCLGKKKKKGGGGRREKRKRIKKKKERKRNNPTTKSVPLQ